MSSGSWNIVFITIWFLLPIIPAYFLFKKLPSTADVSGPLQGLGIKLGGAFGGYIVLFLLAKSVMDKIIQHRYENYEVWSVRGKVVDSETDRPIEIGNNPFVSVQPPSRLTTTGEFSFKLIGERRGENSIEFPNVLVEADGYVPESLGELDYRTGAVVKKEYCEELDVEIKKVSYKTIRLVRLPKIKPTIVQDDTTTTIAYQ